MSASDPSSSQADCVAAQLSYLQTQFTELADSVTSIIQCSPEERQALLNQLMDGTARTCLSVGEIQLANARVVADLSGTGPESDSTQVAAKYRPDRGMFNPEPTNGTARSERTQVARNAQ
jgi:hypothetical protein